MKILEYPVSHSNLLQYITYFGKKDAKLSNTYTKVS